MSDHHPQKTLSAKKTPNLIFPVLRKAPKWGGRPCKDLYLQSLSSIFNLIESDISNPINSTTWIRTRDQMINSHLRYRCAIVECGWWDYVILTTGESHWQRIYSSTFRFLGIGFCNSGLPVLQRAPPLPYYTIPSAWPHRFFCHTLWKSVDFQERGIGIEPTTSNLEG